MSEEPISIRIIRDGAAKVGIRVGSDAVALLPEHALQLGVDLIALASIAGNCGDGICATREFDPVGPPGGA